MRVSETGGSCTIISSIMSFSVAPAGSIATSVCVDTQGARTGDTYRHGDMLNVMETPCVWKTPSSTSCMPKGNLHSWCCGVFLCAGTSTPPTRDSRAQHVTACRHVAGVWRCAAGSLLCAPGRPLALPLSLCVVRQTFVGAALCGTICWVAVYLYPLRIN